MKRTHRFITGSRYDGSFNENLRWMDGFGVYIYPDGSEYRGYFHNGKFHGYGRIKLIYPSRFTVKGRFDHGEIVDVEELTFPDGLRLCGYMDGNHLETDLWRYCDGIDRRYASEINMGLQPVGPESFLTPERPPRPIPPNCYDTEGGIYNPNVGFISERPPPFMPFRFIGCIPERDRILERFRRGPFKKLAPDEQQLPIEPEPHFRKSIIQTNIQSISKLGENLPSCACNELAERKRYLDHLAERMAEKPENATICMSRQESSETCSGLSMPMALKDNIEESIKLELDSLEIPKRCYKLYKNSHDLFASSANVSFNERFSKHFTL